MKIQFQIQKKVLELISTYSDMPKGDDKSYHPIVGDRGVKALKAAIQAHDERVACGFHDFHNILIDLGLNTKEDCVNNKDSCEGELAHGNVLVSMIHFMIFARIINFMKK